MKTFKTFDEQIDVLEQRGLHISNIDTAKHFLERENYYNVINGYKEIFLDKIRTEEQGEDCFLKGATFDELQSLFLMDRELRFVFLKYLLIFENSLKTVISYVFSQCHQESDAYLISSNYDQTKLEEVDKQIAILKRIIWGRASKDGAIKHYHDKYGSVPLWVLVNYLTIGNLSHLYGVMNIADRNMVAKMYSQNYNKQYTAVRMPMRVNPAELETGIKIVNLVRNICAHDERLYSVQFKNTRIQSLVKFYNLNNIDNRRLIVLIIYFKVLLNKDDFIEFYNQFSDIINKYRSLFVSIKFIDILKKMGVEELEFNKLR